MRFHDSDAQRLLRDTARSYLAERFPWERLFALEKDATLTDEELAGFAEMGWLGLLAPEEQGGGGLALLDAATVIEEFGYAAVPAPVAVNNVAAALLSATPRSDAIDGLLADLASGRRLCTVSEASRSRATGATSLSASGGAITGALPLVPFAELAAVVLAPLTLDGEPAFAALPVADAQHEVVRLLDRTGYANLRFEGAPLDRAIVLATGADAEALHERCDALTTALGLIELAGMMQRILEMTTEYVSNRVQFGQPIAKFQAVRHRAAELLTQTETVRWSAYHALWRFQENSNDTDEIWLTKHWAIRAVDRVFEVSHLLHGGVGVGMEYPLHLFTQGIAAFAVRNGGMSEMVERTVERVTA